MRNAILIVVLALAVAACGSKSDEEKAGEVMKEMVGIVKDMAKVAETNKDDCGKMADELDKVIEANKGKLEAAKKFSDEMKAKAGKGGDPEAAKKMMKELGPIMKDMMDSGMTLAGAMMKCQGDEKMKALQEKWEKYQ